MDGIETFAADLAMMLCKARLDAAVIACCGFYYLAYRAEPLDLGPAELTLRSRIGVRASRGADDDECEQQPHVPLQWVGL